MKKFLPPPRNWWFSRFFLIACIIKSRWLKNFAFVFLIVLLLLSIKPAKAFVAPVTFCTCTTTYSNYYFFQDSPKLFLEEYTFEWHYITAGDCSAPSYNFGSADVYLNGEYIGYIYIDQGFTNPCSKTI